MKNAINYYYNLYPENVYTAKHQNYFFIDSIRYTLIKYEEDINELNKIYNRQIEMMRKKLYVHQIILNIEKTPLTFINETPYILLKTLYYGEEIKLDNVLAFSWLKENKEEKNWTKIWSDKNDYLEFQMSELGKKHPILRKSFSYYIGLAETAIALTNNIKKEEIYYTYAHKRINKKDTFLEFYNPLNIIIDTRIRDITEYLKSKYFSGEDIKEELYYYLNNTILTKSEIIMFLARMLYPTYYFDIFEEIITERQNDEKIECITTKTENYEKILKDIYKIIRKNIEPLQIEWLE